MANTTNSKGNAMKKLTCILITLFSLQTFAAKIDSFKNIECSIGQSYGIRYQVSTKVVELWEFANGGSSALPDYPVHSDDRKDGKVILQLGQYGVLTVDFSDAWGWATGTWNHGGKIDKYLYDSPEDYGVAQLHECTME